MRFGTLFKFYNSWSDYAGALCLMQSFVNFNFCFPLVFFSIYRGTPFKKMALDPLACATDVFIFDFLLDIEVGCTLNLNPFLKQSPVTFTCQLNDD